MFSFITVALFVSLAIQGASAGFAINTPAMKQCTPVQISWTHGTSPYTLDIVSADDPCGAALLTIDDLTSTVYHLTPVWASGTEIILFVSDNADDQAWSGNITVGSGSDACTSGGSTISSSSESSTVNPNTQASPAPTSAQGSPAASPSSNTPTFAQGSPAASSSSNTTALGGAINVGTSSGVLTVHRACTPLFSIMALAPILALTL